MQSRLEPDFVEAVLDVVAAIPEGRAMSYGDVAAAIGSRAPEPSGQSWRTTAATCRGGASCARPGTPSPTTSARALEHYPRGGHASLWSADRTVFRVDLRVARYVP